VNRRLVVVAVSVITLVIGIGAVASGFTSRTSSTATASAPAAGAAGTPVAIKDFKFGPTSVTVAAGGSVTWTNQDSFAHSIKSGDGSFDSPDIATGQTFTAKFPTAGTFTYVCGIHNFMTGTVVVTK
jgi:plastocyanin